MLPELLHRRFSRCFSHISSIEYIYVSYIVDAIKEMVFKVLWKFYLVKVNSNIIRPSITCSYEAHVHHGNQRRRVIPTRFPRTLDIPKVVHQDQWLCCCVHRKWFSSIWTRTSLHAIMSIYNYYHNLYKLSDPFNYRFWPSKNGMKLTVIFDNIVPHERNSLVILLSSIWSEHN